MEAFGNASSLCTEAREYYYELLCHDGAAVPEALARHVEHCSFCREQIRRLGDALAEAGDPAACPGAGETIEALGRQFEFLGHQVDCSDVRPFLPDLVIPSHQTRIPTPITVHLEHCPQCKADLASIRELGLAAGQLRRLSLFYDQSDRPDPTRHEQARSAAEALAAFSFDGADPEALNHVSCCPECRARVDRHRARASADLHDRSGRDGVLRCDEVTPADVFDYIVPFGLDATALGKAHGRRDAVVTHVRGCRACLEKARSMHRTLYAVAERAGSGISTLCRSAGDADTGAEANAPDCRYPIDVHILHDRTVPAVGRDRASIGSPRGGRRAPVGFKARRSLQTVLAAAVVVVPLLLLVNSRTATAMSLGDVIKAVQRAANIHVTVRGGNDMQPIQEMLLARDLDVLVFKGDGSCTVYDLRKGLATVIDRTRGPGVPVRLTRDESDRYAAFMSEFARGLFADAPTNAELSQVGNEPADGTAAMLSTGVIEWEVSSGAGAQVLHRQKVFIDPVTRLPLRTQSYRQVSLEQGWELTGATEFEYLSPSEMQRVLRALLAPAQ